jgi:hypothetical protein
MLLRDKDIGDCSLLLCGSRVVDVETRISSRLDGCLTHALISSTRNPRCGYFTSLIDYDGNNNFASAFTSVGGLYEVAAISSGVCKRETYGEASLALRILVLSFIAVFTTIFAYGVSLAQPLLVGLLICYAFALGSLGCGIQFCNIGTFLIFEIFI